MGTRRKPAREATERDPVSNPTWGQTGRYPVPRRYESILDEVEQAMPGLLLFRRAASLGRQTAATAELEVADKTG